MKTNTPRRSNLYTPTYYRRAGRPTAPRTQNHKTHRPIGRSMLAIFIIATLVTLSLYGLNQRNANAKTSNNLMSVSMGSSVSTAEISPMTNAALTRSINSILKQNPTDTIGIALIDMSTNHLQTFGSTRPFTAASTAKVLAAAAFYHLVETGHASLSSPMGDYDAAFNLKEMINDSDNDAWALISNAIGANNLQAYASSIGIPASEYNEANNTLTPAGMATILTKLYEGQLLNQTDTAQLLSYMQNTNYESLIPAALPSDVTVYHKYGLLDGDLHDASIIVENGHAYSLVIYTNSPNGYTDDNERTTIIHQLTNTVISNIFPNS